jgi:hypothetical protein
VALALLLLVVLLSMGLKRLLLVLLHNVVWLGRRLKHTLPD